MNKVVDFPKHKIVREVPVDIEEVTKAKEKGLLNFADGIVDDLIANIYAEFENFGLDMSGETFDKDFSFAMDGIRASVFRVLGIKHHLHDFLDTNVVMKKMSDIRMEIEDSVPELEIEIELDDESEGEEDDTD